MKTQGSHKDVVFLSGVRTGFGGFGGSLKDLSAIELGAVAAQHALERSGVPAADVGHTVFGNALQTSADAIYCARHVGLKAGLPIEVPAVTVNRLCGSGFEAITQGAQLILLGEANAVLAGGTESMSQAPHVVRGARWGLRLGPAAPLEDVLWEALKDPQCGLSMAETAENLAERYKLTRKDVDEVALASQQRAKQAWDACVFQDEVIPVPIKQKGQTVEYRKDEHMRPDTTLQVLLGLKPYFKKDGLVTAGNASGIVDGAAATVIAGEDFAKAHGLKPLGRLVAWAVAGVEPRYMGIGPAPAARKALQKAGMKLEQLDLVEVNEAFAPQYLAVEQVLGLDRAKTNVDGGAVAIGHPLAATGTRITIHLLHALRRRKLRFGLGSACIGGGQGAAVIVEKNYLCATSQLAQTTLRSVLGETELDELLMSREKINNILKNNIDKRTENWGIEVTAVEVKDVDLPPEMKRAMARQAEAERERRAKNINAEGELQASEKLAQAAHIIGSEPAAIQLRYLQTVTEISSENNSTTFFPIPIDLLKGFFEAVTRKPAIPALPERTSGDTVPAEPKKTKAEA